MDVSKLYARVEEAHKKKNFDFAIELLKNQILKFNPNDVKARQLLRGTVLKKFEGTTPNKVTALTKGLLPLIKMLLGKMLKKWEMVVDEAENYLQYDPKNTLVLYALGEACKQAKYLDAAFSVFDNILAFDPNNARALKALGTMCLERREGLDPKTQKEEITKALQEAKKYFERAATLSPGDIESPKKAKDISAQLTSLIYEDAKSSRDLIKDQDKAKELEKDKSVLRTEQDVIEAIESVKKKLVDDPQNKKELRRLGDLYQKSAHWDEAIQTFETVLQLDPTSFDIKCRIGECKIAKIEQKVQELQEKFKKNPQDARCKQELQKIQQAKNELEIQEYDVQVKAQPTNHELRFKLAVALFQGGRFDDSIANFQHAIKDPKYKIQAYNYMGQAFNKKQDYDLAIEQFKTIMPLVSNKESTQYREVLYNLGLAYEAAKKYPDAIETYMNIYRADIGFRDIQARIKKLRDMAGKS